MKTSALRRTALATGIAALTVGALPMTAQADDGTTGKRKMLPVLVEFSDSAFQDIDAVKKSTPETYFGTSEKSVSKFFTEVSRGQYTLTPAVDEKFLTVKIPSAVGCDSSKMNDETQAALKEQGLVRGEDYESLSMIFPGQKSGCDWAGLGSVPGPYTWVNLVGTESGVPLVGHELGHNLGFGHQMRTMCTDGDLMNCKEDGTSGKTIMGGGGPATGFSAPEMIGAGWLDNDTEKVTKSGTYTLRSLHGEGTGTRALNVKMGDDRLVVEYRHKAGSFDGHIEGVHAYRVPEEKYGSATLIDLTEENNTSSEDTKADADAVQTLTDKAGKVSVEVVSSGKGSATVKVALNGESLSGLSDEAADDKSSGSDSTEVQGGSSETVGDTSATSGEDLAATGGNSSTLPITLGGAALVAAGAGALVVTRRKRRA